MSELETKCRHLVLVIIGIVSAEPLQKARFPSYHIIGDIGNGILKSSCAKFVRNYPNPGRDLIGRKFLALLNVPSKRVAGIKSEMLILGFPDFHNDGQAIGIVPLRKEMIPIGAPLHTLEDCNHTIPDEDGTTLFFSMKIISGTLMTLDTGKSSIIDAKDSQIYADIGLLHPLPLTLPAGFNISKCDLVGIQVPIYISDDSNSNTGSLFFSKGINNALELLKIDNPVQNGLQIF